MVRRAGFLVVSLLGLLSFAAVIDHSPAVGAATPRDHLVAVAVGGFVAIACVLALIGLWVTSWQRERRRE